MGVAKPKHIFPVDEVPEAPGAARLAGLYPQRQEGFFMQRIKVPGGRITTAQWRAVADLAVRYTPDYPLHITTRQDIQLHGVRPEDVPAVQQGIADAGLTASAACGDSLRNITVCPDSGLVNGALETGPIVDAIRSSAGSLPWIRDLPRKFKINITGCPDLCTAPWVNCLAFVADRQQITALGAGSLGPRPATGIRLYGDLDPADIVPLTIAALRMFNAEGDRENRARARFRHVRERMGDGAFRHRLDSLFRREREERDWPVPPFRRTENGKKKSVRLHLPLGDIDPQAARAVADAADGAGGVMRLGLVHDLCLYADERPALDPALEGLQDGTRVISCPGSTWCSNGLADSRAAETEIRKALPGHKDLSICISGCPNGCTHAGVADIGLVGRVKRFDGTRTPSFQLLAGGENGRGPGLSRRLHPAIPASRAAEAVAWLVTDYEQGGHADGLDFSEFVAGEAERLTERLERRFSTP